MSIKCVHKNIIPDSWDDEVLSFSPFVSPSLLLSPPPTQVFFQEIDLSVIDFNLETVPRVAVPRETVPRVFYGFQRKVIKKDPKIELMKAKKIVENKIRQEEANLVFKEQKEAELRKNIEKNILKFGVAQPNRFVGRAAKVQKVIKTTPEIEVQKVIETTSEIEVQKVIETTSEEEEVEEEVEEDVAGLMKIWIGKHDNDSDLQEIPRVQNVHQVEFRTPRVVKGKHTVTFCPKSLIQQRKEEKGKCLRVMCNIKAGADTVYAEHYEKRGDGFKLLTDINVMKTKLLKTRMCRSVATKTPCKHSNCRYAHSTDELTASFCAFNDSCKLVRTIGGKIKNRNKNKICEYIHIGETKEEFNERIKPTTCELNDTNLITYSVPVFKQAPILPPKMSGWLSTVSDKSTVVVRNSHEMTFKIPMTALSTVLKIIKKMGYTNIKLEIIN